MKNRAWVVFQGRVPGVYLDVVQAQEQVHTFPNNMYKGFSTPEDANCAWESYLQRHQRMAAASATAQQPDPGTPAVQDGSSDGTLLELLGKLNISQTIGPSREKMLKALMDTVEALNKVNAPPRTPNMAIRGGLGGGARRGRAGPAARLMARNERDESPLPSTNPLPPTIPLPPTLEQTLNNPTKTIPSQNSSLSSSPEGKSGFSSDLPIITRTSSVSPTTETESPDITYIGTMPKFDSTSVSQKRKRGRPFLAKSSNCKSTSVTSKAESSSAIDGKLKSLPSSQKKLNFFALKESGKEDGAAIDAVEGGDDVLVDGAKPKAKDPDVKGKGRLLSSPGPSDRPGVGDAPKRGVKRPASEELSPPRTKQKASGFRFKRPMSTIGAQKAGAKQVSAKTLGAQKV